MEQQHIGKQVKVEQELAGHFAFLDGLRESGVTNMFGAVPYLCRYQKLDKTTAAKVLGQWMRTFRRDESPESRAVRAGGRS